MLIKFSPYDNNIFRFVSEKCKLQHDKQVKWLMKVFTFFTLGYIIQLITH